VGDGSGLLFSGRGLATQSPFSSAGRTAPRLGQLGWLLREESDLDDISKVVKIPIMPIIEEAVYSRLIVAEFEALRFSPRDLEIADVFREETLVATSRGAAGRHNKQFVRGCDGSSTA
jgi:hypothetical protein